MENQPPAQQENHNHDMEVAEKERVGKEVDAFVDPVTEKLLADLRTKYGKEDVDVMVVVNVRYKAKCGNCGEDHGHQLTVQRMEGKTEDMIDTLGECRRSVLQERFGQRGAGGFPENRPDNPLAAIFGMGGGQGGPRGLIAGLIAQKIKSDLQKNLEGLRTKRVSDGLGKTKRAVKPAKKSKR